MEAAAAVPTPTFIPALELADVVESRLNPRKSYDVKALEELAESIRKVGVQQPISVRKVDGLYEVIFGHRRFRAAKMAGLTVIPALLSDVADDQVLALQLIENGKRADFSPVEEAEGYQTLHGEFGKSVPEIAATVDRSEAHVYQRLALLKLPPAAVEALAAGRMSLEVALAIARIPNEQLRAEATAEILTERLRPDYDHKTHEEIAVKAPIGTRAALELLRRRYSLRLSGADFDLADAELGPVGVGACDHCPKRSRNQVALFPDLADGEDLCLDPNCYERKREAAWKVRKAAEEAKGRTVLDGKAAADVVGDFGQLKPGYLKPESRVSTDPKNRTVAQILGKSGLEKSTILARAKDGHIHEAIPLADVTKAVKAATKAAGLPDEKEQKAKAKAQEAAEREENARKAHIDELTAAFSVELLVRDFERVSAERWGLVGELMLEQAVRNGDSSYLEVALRRGLVEMPKGGSKKGAGEAFEEAAQKALRAELRDSTEAQTAGIVLELLLAQAGAFETWGGDGPALVKRLAKDWAIDLGEAKRKAKETVKAGDTFVCNTCDKTLSVKDRIPGGFQCRSCYSEHCKKHGMSDDHVEEAPKKPAKKSSGGNLWKPGDRVLYSQGKGSFEAFVIRLEDDQAHLERVADGKKVIRAVDTLKPAPES